MSQVNFSLSENPNHYLMLVGTLYLIGGGWIIIKNNFGFSLDYWAVWGSLFFGLALCIIGYIRLRNYYLIKADMVKTELEIKKEELRLLRKNNIVKP